MATPLLIGPTERAQLTALRELANDHPIDMLALLHALKLPKGKALHRQQMTRQTVTLPLDFMVTMSIETGHPVGTCRHMSMSSPNRKRVPSPEAVWLVADLLGFTVGLWTCTHWLEQLEGHGRAVNVLQPISPFAPGGTA